MQDSMSRRKKQYKPKEFSEMLMFLLRHCKGGTIKVFYLLTETKKEADTIQKNSIRNI